MGRRIRKATAGLGLALCLVAAALSSATSAHASGATGTHEAHTSAATALPGGVNVLGIGDFTQAAQVDRAIAQAHALHAKLIRTVVSWSALEPSGPQQIDPSTLAIIDRLISDATAADIRVIVSVDSTPCWASSAPSSLLATCEPGRESKANSWPPNEPAYYGAFTGYLAKRYGTGLAAIEVWNEPDQANEDYLAGPSKPERYAALLRAAYPAIKAVDPSLPVLAGSLVGSNGVFLRALYAAGIKGYYDGLAVHFYNLTLGSLRSIHEVQLANGDNTPLWLDEFGWSSCWPAQSIEQEQACVTPKLQASNLASTYRELVHTPWVAAAVMYKLADSISEDFGLTNTSGARKPAFAAFANALASPFAKVTPIVLELRRKGAQVIASGSAPVGDFMGLEAFEGKLLRYRAIFKLDRFNRYSLVLPSALGTHALRVRVFQYWSGRSKAAQKRV
jgi:polysaccharide biosynthesis protein PslG